MHLWMRLSWLAILSVLALVFGGCGGGGQQTGSAYVFIAWPAALAHTRAGFTGMQSVKLELFNGGASFLSRTQNRPADVTQSQVVISELALGSYRFLATAYDGPDATGAILGQTAGTVSVTLTLASPVYLTTVRQAGARLLVTPDNPTVYIGRTITLTATARNVDNAYLFIAPDTVQWASASAAVATVVPLTGVVSGVGEGQTVITANDGIGLIGNTTVSVRYPPPTVDLTVDDDSLKPGDSAKLSWVSTDAEQVVSSVNFNTSVLNGTLTIFPVETTIYRITVSGRGGTATDSITVRVVYPQPTLTLSANSSSVNAGDAVTLTWTSNYATSVVRAENFNTQAVNGSIIVRPNQTTTYALTVRGPGGDTTAYVTVTVSSGQGLQR
jgi:hypothetical protein